MDVYKLSVSFYRYNHRTLTPASVSILTRGSLIVADVIIIAVTWIRLRHQVKEAWASGLANTISVAMLVNGEATVLSSPGATN